MFLSQAWGNGYAFETICELLNYAFNILGLSEVVAETQAANSASCALLKKLGFSDKQRITRFGEEQIIWIKNR